MQTEPIKPIKPKYDQLLRDFYAQLRAIHIEQLERKWITISMIVIGLFVGIITIDAFFHGVNPPSKVETVDSASLHLNKEFAEDNLGVQVDAKGNVISQNGCRALFLFSKTHQCPCRDAINLTLGQYGCFTRRSYPHDQHEHDDCAGLCCGNNHHLSETGRISCAV